MSRQSDSDNHANQLNPNNDAYWESRGYDERPEDWEGGDGHMYSQSELDNRANQLNPEHDAYWQSRGFEGRPNSTKDDGYGEEDTFSPSDVDGAGIDPSRGQPGHLLPGLDRFGEACELLPEPVALVERLVTVLCVATTQPADRKRVMSPSLSSHSGSKHRVHAESVEGGVPLRTRVTPSIQFGRPRRALPRPRVRQASPIPGAEVPEMHFREPGIWPSHDPFPVRGRLYLQRVS